MDDIKNQNKSVNGFIWSEKVKDKSFIEDSKKIHSLDETLAKILSTREIKVENIDNFLNPKFKNFFPDPYSLCGMKKSVERIVELIFSKKKIGIFGDYDVDGATSTSLLLRFLKDLNTSCEYYIPDRILEGYGPNINAFKKLKKLGCDIIVTVDCGISSNEEVKKAKKEGIEVIIVDHHQQSKILPEAFSIINPNQQIDESGLNNLAAVGVTFLLIVAITKKLKLDNFFLKNKEPYLLKYLDLVALGTVCDVVKLDLFNRAIVSNGIKIINRTQNLGIKSLIDNTNIKDEINEYHLGFILGPRINAGGRIGNASLGVKLLTSDNVVETNLLAEKLTDLNQERQKIESKVEKLALEKVNIEKDIIFVHSKNWHVGVIGIVASRLVEKFGKPAIVVSESMGICKGSCRSVGDFNIGLLIKEAYEKNILLSGGGHKMAAGLSIENTKLQDFEAFLNNKRIKNPKKNKFFDLNIKIASFNTGFYKSISKLSPYGAGNPKPIFCIKNSFIKYAKIVGNGHVSCLICDLYGNTIKAIAFKAVDNALGNSILNDNGKFKTFIGNMVLNRWSGSEVIEFQLIDAIELIN